MPTDDTPQGGTSSPPSQSQSALSPDILRGLEKLIERSGTPRDASEVLYRENYELREERRRLQHELNARPQLQDGQVVLSKEEAERFKAYKELGSIEDLRTIKSEQATLQWKSTVSEVAQRAGLNVDVLTMLMTENQTLKMIGEGDHAQVVVVDGDTQTAVSELEDSSWKAFKAILRVQPSEDEGHGSRAPEPKSDQNGHPASFIRQSGPKAAAGKASTVLEGYLAAKEARLKDDKPKF